MRCALLLCDLAATRASADPALLQCLSPEMADRTAAIRDTAPCAAHPTCEAPPLSAYAGAVEPACLPEAEPVACLRDVAGTVDRLTDQVRPRLTEARMAAANLDLPPLRRRSIEAALGRHRAAPSDPCDDPGFRAAVASAVPEGPALDATCTANMSFQGYQEASALDRRLVAAEKETQ